MTQKCPGRLGDPGWPWAQLTPGPWDDTVLGLGRLLRQELAWRDAEGTWRGCPRVGLGVLSPEHSGIQQVGASVGPAHECPPGAAVRASLLLPSLAASLHFPPLVCGIVFPLIIRLPWQCSPLLPSGAIPGKGSWHVTPAHWERVLHGPHTMGWLPICPTVSTGSTLPPQHPATHQATGGCLSPACSGDPPHDSPISHPSPNPLLGHAPSPSSPSQSLCKGRLASHHLLPPGRQPEQLAAANQPLQLGC